MDKEDAGCRSVEAVRVRGLVAVWLALLCGRAFAHSMYQSSMLLDFHAGGMDVELQLPPSRLGQAMGLEITEGNLASLGARVEPYLLQRFSVRSKDGEWVEEMVGPVVWKTVDGAPYVVAHLRVSAPGEVLRRFTLEDDVITDVLPSHTVLVSVRSDWDAGTFANDPELLGVLSGDERSMEVMREGGRWAKGFGSVFHLGVRHIAEGTDHLLFLLALLLPAPLLCVAGRWGGFAGVRHGAVQILKVVTAFTVGHSITLALAASGVMRVPERPIEVLIAVSILVSAVHALRPLFPGREALIAAGFGLIHGLAFASTLAELGLHRWERVESIFAFNVGIEAMQLVVVACVMPSLMLLSRTRGYGVFRVAGALFAAAAASGWIVERVSGRSVGVDRVVDGLAKHGVLLAAGLLVASSASFLLMRLRNDAEVSATAT